ncbi:MAG TPA: DUF1844 domain-containing protein [Candidatus Krumholzibacteria bacterium]|nr:DUF1844 domain-containing protein [Candidatus Krumholzibacteria bacterium]HRX50223.1 DUF1844 domain-containing protein [Candidatus Krumholzibacteria bacterium]
MHADAPTPDLDRHDQHLLGLIMNLQAAAMVQLGKMVDPHSGALARDLEAARFTVDLLESVKVKTAGNLAPEITTHLDRVVMELQLNYADERRKDAAAPADAAAPEAERDEA